jgi:hypothetical protein
MNINDIRTGMTVLHDGDMDEYPFEVVWVHQDTGEVGCRGELPAIAVFTAEYLTEV